MIITAGDKMSKNNKPYGYFEVEDFKGSVRLNLWSENFDKFKHLMEIGKCIFISGKVDKRFWDKEKENDPNAVIEYEIKIQSIEPLYDLMERRAKSLLLTIPLEYITSDIVKDLGNMIQNNPGKVDLKMRVFDAEEEVFVDMNSHKRKINPETFLKEIQKMDLVKVKLS